MPKLWPPRGVTHLYSADGKQVPIASDGSIEVDAAHIQIRINEGYTTSPPVHHAEPIKTDTKKAVINVRPHNTGKRKAMA